MPRASHWMEVKFCCQRWNRIDKIHTYGIIRVKMKESGHVFRGRNTKMKKSCICCCCWKQICSSVTPVMRHALMKSSFFIEILVKISEQQFDAEVVTKMCSNTCMQVSLQSKKKIMLMVMRSTITLCIEMYSFYSTRERRKKLPEEPVIFDATHCIKNEWVSPIHMHAIESIIFRVIH